MGNAALALVDAVICRVQQTRQLGCVLAVVVTGHGGHGITCIGHGCGGPHPEKEFTAADACAGVLLPMRPRIKFRHGVFLQWFDVRW